MKNKTVAAVLLVVGIVSLGMSVIPITVQTLSETNVTLKVNSETQHFENEPLIQNGVTYVPLRESAESLGFQVEWDEENRNIDINTYHKTVPHLIEAEIVAEQGVIPDKDTAISVGKAILEAAMGRSVEYQENGREFSLTATYYPKDNAWRVQQIGRYEGRMWYGTNFHTPFVVLNKNTGEVTNINLYPQAELGTPLGRDDEGAPIWPGRQEDTEDKDKEDKDKEDKDKEDKDKEDKDKEDKGTVSVNPK